MSKMKLQASTGKFFRGRPRHALGLTAMLCAVGVTIAATAENSAPVPAAPSPQAAKFSSGPICSVSREVYLVSPGAGLAPVVNVKYLGEGLRRREIVGLQGKSDLAEKIKVRFSEDNGRTWSPLVPLDTGPDALRQGDNFRDMLPYLGRRFGRPFAEFDI